MDTEWLFKVIFKANLSDIQTLLSNDEFKYFIHLVLIKGKFLSFKLFWNILLSLFEKSLSELIEIDKMEEEVINNNEVMAINLKLQNNLYLQILNSVVKFSDFSQLTSQ